MMREKYKLSNDITIEEFKNYVSLCLEEILNEIRQLRHEIINGRLKLPK